MARLTSQMKSMVLEIGALDKLHLCEIQALTEPITVTSTSCSGGLFGFYDDAPIF